MFTFTIVYDCMYVCRIWLVWCVATSSVGAAGASILLLRSWRKAWARFVLHLQSSCLIQTYILCISSLYFIIQAAFTPDTCSPDTSCIHLCPLSLSTCILYRQQNCHHGYMYPRVERCLELVSVDMYLLQTRLMSMCSICVWFCDTVCLFTR